MLTLLATGILGAGVYVTLHPRLHFGFFTELCIALASLFAGAYVVGKDYIALLYCIIAIITGYLYYKVKHTKVEW